MDMIQATLFFGWLLSNFLCKLSMLIGRTLYWILVLRSKVKIIFSTLSIKPCRYHTDYNVYFCPDRFQSSNSYVSCWWWEDESKWFLVFGSKVKVKFCTLSLIPCEQDTNDSLGPITFKLHRKVEDGERRNPIDFESWGQRSMSSLALCLWNLMDTIQTTVFPRLLSNFTC